MQALGKGSTHFRRFCPLNRCLAPWSNGMARQASPVLLRGQQHYQQQQLQAHQQARQKSTLMLPRVADFPAAAVNEAPAVLRTMVQKKAFPERQGIDSALWKKARDDRKNLLLNDLDLSTNRLQYWPAMPPGVKATADPFQLVQAEVNQVMESMQDNMLNTHHPVLKKVALFFLEGWGQRNSTIRPTVVLLLARALEEHTKGNAKTTAGLGPVPVQHPHADVLLMRLAEVSQLFYKASLLHNDIVERGSEAAELQSCEHQATFGSKVSILAGDYLLARAMVLLGRMGNVNVVEAMSTILDHQVTAEVMLNHPHMMVARGSVQAVGNYSNIAAAASTDTDAATRHRLEQMFFKTASLTAHSCQSVAFQGEYSQDLVDISYRFGKHLGMSLELVQDMKKLQSMGGVALMDMEYTQTLACLHAEAAMDALLCLRPSTTRDALIQLAHQVVFSLE